MFLQNVMQLLPVLIYSCSDLIHIFVIYFSALIFGCNISFMHDSSGPCVWPIYFIDRGLVALLEECLN